MTNRIAVVLVSGLSAVVIAQNRPDFSGVWVPTLAKADAPAATGGVAALPPSDLTVQHTAASLAVSRTAFDTVTTQTFKLDNSETTNRSGAVTKVTRSRWDGSRLIVEGRASQVTSAGFAAWTLKETYYLNARGRLVLESEHRAGDGTITSSTREFTRKPAK